MNNYKKQVKKLFKELGVVQNLKGYNYLLDGISLVKEDKLFYKNGKFMQLYKKIADIYNVTPKSVEKAMIHSVDKAYLEGHMDLFDEIFGVYSKGKISVSLFVFAIVEELEVEKAEKYDDLKTAKKPRKELDGLNSYFSTYNHYCPKCNQPLNRFTHNFCNRCGTKIDWSEEDERL